MSARRRLRPRRSAFRVRNNAPSGGRRTRPPLLQEIAQEIAMANESLPLLPHEQPLAPRTDAWVAASFLVFSVAILAFGWRMPTYTDQGGQIYTAPALVPSFYGVVILVLSLWLAVRSI